MIAQEVRMLYPWAVLEGKDGYLRVQYDMLREMVYLVRNKRLSLFVQRPHADPVFPV